VCGRGGCLCVSSVADRLNTRRRERWCAIDENLLYEFEPVMGEMTLRDKHNLEGCVCYLPEGSTDTFIVRTAGLFRYAPTACLSGIAWRVRGRHRRPPPLMVHPLLRVSVRVHAWASSWKLTCMYIYTYICIHVYMYTCIHVCIHVYMYTCIHLCIYTYIHVYIKYIYTSIHIYIYTYIHTYMYT
jgi:hypothetical protein